MADIRKKGKEFYGVGKIQRRRQLQLARASKRKASESGISSADVGESSVPSSETMAAEV